MSRALAIKPPDGGIAISFDNNLIEIRVDQIIPLKIIDYGFYATPKYKQIFSSIQEIGIIEPPVVVADSNIEGRYILLDGHIRIEALKRLGEMKVICLLSLDDEAFTYNKHINRVSPIQEHRMIIRAIERGVSEAKLAKALSLNVSSIIRKRDMLDGICEEVVDMFKDKMVSTNIFPILRQMQWFRQIEVATLMNDTNVYSVSYARALLAATAKKQLVEPDKPRKIKGLGEEQMARMETEMANLQGEYRLIEEGYGTDVLNLTLAKSYLSALLANARVVRYLAQYHPEILKQFQKISEMTSLGDGGGTA